MRRKNIHLFLSLLLVMALLLSGCGIGQTEPAETEPAETVQPEESAAPVLPEGAVSVATVDELLAAIAPNRVIMLQEGDYDLSAASDYGQEDLRGNYHWELVYGGCALVISDVPGLHLIGQGEVNILAKPRYAEVLSFRNSWDLCLEGLTLGHTQEAGPCSAGVLTLFNCTDVELDNCRLFGCGSMGITAQNCQSVFVRNSRIDSCSDGAVNANNCRDFRLEDCQVCDCGLGQDMPGSNLIYAERCVGFALVNCEITGNRVNQILWNQWSNQVAMLGCQVQGNRILGTVFHMEGRSMIVDQCSFQRRSNERYYSGASDIFVKNLDGEELISFDLDHMEWARAEYDGPIEIENERPASISMPDGKTEVHVSTVDELLAAIAPDTVIVLEDGGYDLSQASGYGEADGEWYRWEDTYDGYELCIEGLSGLWICGSGPESALISAKPRYADVIAFVDCRDIGLVGFTAGHSEAPGYCTGNVLDFRGCQGVSIENCGLFGCGVIGIQAWDCENLQVRETEIYECSYAGASIELCNGVSFEGCSIHDCDEGNNIIYVYNGTIAWDGEILSDGIHRFDRGQYVGSLETSW